MVEFTEKYVAIISLRDYLVENEAISVISDTEQRRCSRRGASSCTFSADEGNGKEADLENGELEMKVYRKRERRKDCRICHLSVAGNGRNSGDWRIIELSCCCKGDLGSAHKQCAETWFKIKGNTRKHHMFLRHKRENPSMRRTSRLTTRNRVVLDLDATKCRCYWSRRTILPLLLVLRSMDFASVECSIQ